MEKKFKEKLISHWVSGARRAWKVSHHLFDGKHYPEALFFGHLAVEKLLKALVVLNNPHIEEPPFIHHLVELATRAKLKLTDRQTELRKVS